MKALDLLAGRKIDHTFYPVVYGLTDEDDWHDEANWYPQQRLVNYDLCHAIPIFEGKVDKENESAQESAQAAYGAENIGL